MGQSSTTRSATRTGAGGVVEGGDVGAVEGEHDRVFSPAGCGPPVCDHLLERHFAVGGLDDVAVFRESLDRLVDLAGAELGERVPFDRILLATVLDELDCAEPFAEAGERAAGFDLGELARITDQHDLGVGVVGVVEEPGEFAGSDHRGFVRDDHGLGW